ncbi:hypothetical protein FJY93_00765 [Candidatus Kaiserbacteria bacterium]|nr:hypothetical protein [Candidatus Kaiserbacteria bacterium]
MSYQYIHQSHYGHAGGVHTAKPIMAMDKHGNFFDMKDGKPSVLPIYQTRGGKVFATEYHPSGVSNHAMFEIKGDKIHTTAAHPSHNASSHTFVIKPGEMYT